MTPPAVPRPAATVLLVRDGAAGWLEVLVLRRTREVAFVPGAHVFPGGAVEPSDHELAGSRGRGRDELQACARTGLARGALGYWAAAIRETYEEVGVLLATDAHGRPVRPDRDPALHRHLTRHRAGVATGEVDLHDVLAAHDLWLPFDQLRYLAHWITPPVSPRRYDTRFFVAAMPPGQSADPDLGEATECEWVRPDDALHRARRGTIELIEPTRRCLDALSHYTSADGLLHALAQVDASDRTDVVDEGGGMRVRLPHDEPARRSSA